MDLVCAWFVVWTGEQLDVLMRQNQSRQSGWKEDERKGKEESESAYCVSISSGLKHFAFAASQHIQNFIFPTFLSSFLSHFQLVPVRCSIFIYNLMNFPKLVVHYKYIWEASHDFDKPTSAWAWKHFRFAELLLILPICQNLFSMKLFNIRYGAIFRLTSGSKYSIRQRG